jgi:uroporphyrinogen-III decarboxylase
MHDQHWNDLKAALRGESKKPMPIAFIIDCPWLPNWFSVSILEYFQSDDVWFQANKKAIETFPECIFLPGFWSEFGMCTEPSAFGVKCQFPENEFPFAQKCILSEEAVDGLEMPDVTTDGLLPFMLNRLTRNRSRIEKMGHKIRFSVSRGPLNIASFLMGTTEFLMMLGTDPERTHRLLRLVTDYLIAWHVRQREAVDSIDGMLVLDDIVGFVSEADYMQFAHPYLKEMFDAPVSVKLFHNDADCRQSVKHYPDLGINLYNPGVHLSMNDLHKATGNKLTILGNIPPRDVLAAGTPDQVREAVKKMVTETADKSRIVASCAGGMPPGVSTANLRAFIEGMAGV